MEPCLACGAWNTSPGLCMGCRRTLWPSPDRVLHDGLHVRSLFVHEGAGRELVRRLKYGGVRRVASILGPQLAQLLPAAVDGLVPVPRSAARRLRYGIDSAGELAGAIARHSGLPVLDVLAAPLIVSPHSGRTRDSRKPVTFRLRHQAPVNAVVVDDVVTTGITLMSAHRTLGRAAGAVTVTNAAGVTSLFKHRRPGDDARRR